MVMWSVAGLMCSPILRCIGEGNHDVLIDEDEEGQQEAQAHGTDNVQG